MSFVSLPEDKEKITLADSDGNQANFWVKKTLSKKDINYGFLAMIEATRNLPQRKEEIAIEPTREAQPVNLTMVLGMPEGQLAVLEKSIIEWDLTYPPSHPDSPQPIPLNQENIQSLTSEVVDALCDKIKKLNHAMTLEESRNLGSNSLHTSIQESHSQTN